MTLSRPVCSRAIRMAFSFASAPPLVKNTFSMCAGAWDRILAAAVARTWLACAGATVARLVACCAMAAMTLGCWWPMLVFTSWLEKSRYVLPSWSHTVLPEPPAIAIELRDFCADQEWKTFARSRAMTSALLTVPLLTTAPGTAVLATAESRIAWLAAMTVPLGGRIGEFLHHPVPRRPVPISLCTISPIPFDVFTSLGVRHAAKPERPPPQPRTKAAPRGARPRVPGPGRTDQLGAQLRPGGSDTVPRRRTAAAHRRHPVPGGGRVPHGL